MMEKQQLDDPSAKEATKTWGFRRSTIARREFIEEIGNLDLDTSTSRRNQRQPRGRGRGRGRGKKPGDTTSSAPKKARGGKRAVQTKLEPESDSDNFITASHQLCLPQKTRSDLEASDQAEDSDELTLRELQERARKRQRSEENSTGTADLNAEIVNKDEEDSCGLLESEVNVSSLFERMASGFLPITESQKSAQGLQEEEEQDKQNDADVSSDGDEEYSDPNAIYCICQQKHNNRFMICCDRCSEWYHGDCVGISEARGRLLEKNGEDYICPSCSPCQSPFDFMNQQPGLCRDALSSSSESLFTSSAGEERPSEDEGVKGKIRKSSTRSTKRRFKIFQPVEIVEAPSEPEGRAAAREQDVAEEPAKAQEDDTVETANEKDDAPKCIGPGCRNDALPESVYCGHQCIIRHAAAAMHGLSEPKVQPEIKNKPAPKPTLKIHNLGKLFKKKPAEKPVQVEDGGSKETGSTPAASLTPDPVRNAMGEQRPAAVASAQFYKATSTGSEKETAKIKPDKTSLTAHTETLTAPSEAPAAEKATEEPAPSAPPFKKPTSNPLPSRAKKTMPGSPRLAVSRQLLNEVPQANKSVFTAPPKPCQSQEASNTPQASNSSPDVRVLPVTPAPVPPSRPLQTHPNMQMRQNIRRSLVDTLLKRVKDSDDLDIPKSEVEKLAVNIEREMFNMYYTTDNKYKIKYRSVLLSLKDPKNKILFYQVVKGHITPFKLTRLSDPELLSVQESVANPLPLKEQPPPLCADTEHHPSGSESKMVKTDSTAASLSEGKLSPVRQAQMKKPSTAVSDIISSMLKDTTAEHKTHLFDLKCRICTGQISADEDPDAKMLKKDEPKIEQEEKNPSAVPASDKNLKSAGFRDDSNVMESPASPTAEDYNAPKTQPAVSPPVIPAVSIVTITRRDPRTAGYLSAASSSVVPVSVPAPDPASVSVPDPPKYLTTIPNVKETVKEPKAAECMQPPAPPLLMPKSILMKPSATSVPRFYGSPGLNTGLPSSHTPADSETINFLSKQDTLWKGFLNMQSVAKFVTKGCIISGSAEVLKKDLPDTVHIGGRILPQTVWEYVERVKTSLTKELSLIRFYPASDEEEVAYVSLFSYFNSRSRFGVVSNIGNNIKDIYLIPLRANEPIPSVLLPIEGPGLEQNHPNLLIGLAVCQKSKRPGAQMQDTDEKRPRIQIPQDPQVMNLPTISAVKHDEPYDPDIAISTTPPESPSSLRSPNLSSFSLNASSGTSALSNIHAAETTPASTSTVAKIMSSNVPPLYGTSSTTNTPLQTILNTIFGKKKQSPDFALSETAPTAINEPAIPSPTVDPIVQQYHQASKTTVEFDDNDRPYDPEEEYDPALGYQKLSPLKPLEMSKPNMLPTGAKDCHDDDRPYDPEEEYNLGKKVDSSTTIILSATEPLLGNSAVKDDVEYDPEDDTVFEELQNYLTDNKSANSERGTSSTMSLSEQQKMLEDLNRQIEEQKRQLAEQEEALRIQRAAVGVSMAHFSVSDALMSPPPRFGREPDEEAEKTLTDTAVNLNRDARLHLRQNTVNPAVMSHSEIVNEKWECSQSSLVNNSLEHHLSKNDQDLSLGKSNDKRSSSVNMTVRNSARNSEKRTHMGASERQEGTSSSSSGNKNVQHSHSSSEDSGKTRQSRSSQRKYHSPPQRRSGQETRRSYHEKRSSDRSKDDGRRRRGRRSPEQSSRRSRSHRRGKERTSSRERERHLQKGTSSRHSSTRDRQHSSSRSRSTRSRTSPELGNNQSDQKEKSSSRQKNEPNTETTDGTNNVAPKLPQIQSDTPQNEASGSGEPKVTKIQKADITKLDTDQSSHTEQPSSERSCGTQRKQVQLEPNQIQNDCTSKANPLHRVEFHKNKPHSEKLSIHPGRNNESRNTRHQHCSLRENVLHNSETDFSHGTDKQSLWKESEHLPQKMPKIEGGDFPETDVVYSRNPRKVWPQRPSKLRGNDPEMVLLQNQKSNFLMDDKLHSGDLTQQGVQSVECVDLPQLESHVQRNIHPRDEFRPRAPEVQWRGPHHRMGGPRGPTHSRIPRAPHPERFEGCRLAGPRGPRPRIFDDCGSCTDFVPRGPTSSPGLRRFRLRGPSPVPSPHSSGPKGRVLRPGMFEAPEPQSFGPRDEFSDPDMYDGSFTFAGSTQREFDRRDPHLEDVDNSWACNVPHQVDREPFLEFRHPRGRGPPQQYHENMFDSRDSEQMNFNDSRHRNLPFDEEEIGHLPLQHSEDPRDYAHNFANESFLNPQEPRGHQNLTPHPVRTRSPAHARNRPQRARQFDECRDQAMELETEEPHFAKPDIFEDSIGCESATELKVRRFNRPQNIRAPRAPSPHFHDKRMPSQRNTDLHKDKPCSSQLSLLSTPKPPGAKVPNAIQHQNPMQPRIRFDTPTKEPGIRPLRLSGPLLPTPPGGPIRFYKP